jgi:23S rRNA (pseudouridine1915-N3)-methyltransferase
VILRLVHPGSAPKGALEEAARDYRQRLERSFRVEETFVRAARGDDPRAGLAQEGERIVAGVRDRDHLVALDRTGTILSSEALAQRLSVWMQSGHGAVVFALGSASGLAESVLERADERWSFGPLTLPHDLARVVLWEQLYRALTILRGEPYHK